MLAGAHEGGGHFGQHRAGSEAGGESEGLVEESWDDDSASAEHSVDRLFCDVFDVGHGELGDERSSGGGSVVEGGGGGSGAEGADSDVGAGEFFVDGFVEVEYVGFGGSVEGEIWVGLERGG